MDTRELNSFFTESFRGDILKRELRLSEEEMRYIKQRFPRAHVTPVHDPSSSNKVWYTVTLNPQSGNQFFKP
ncbi:hypothetical protein [Lentibacillus saliphilus]|uniref:hypothetical protein n=1 Tax=Lentibacillus saliphilus TaxID=2737028 RepID=UPI001C3004A2|nr:hypothetical protein [Lentibacillus saliphilus]